MEHDTPPSALDASASLHVFNTIELLEQILLYLDTKNLVRLQRVCHQWRDVMDRSKILQEALFLSPSPVRAFAPWKRTPPPPFARLSTLIKVSAKSPEATPITTLHPALQEVPANVPNTRIDFVLDARTLLTCSPASWRATFVTQPPTTYLTLSCIFEWDYPQFDTVICQRRIEDENGVRLGNVLAAIRQDLDDVSKQSKDAPTVSYNYHAH